jgi:hypothetical protein
LPKAYNRKIKIKKMTAIFEKPNHNKKKQAGFL